MLDLIWLCTRTLNEFFPVVPDKVSFSWRILSPSFSFLFFVKNILSATPEQLTQVPHPLPLTNTDPRYSQRPGSYPHDICDGLPSRFDHDCTHRSRSLHKLLHVLSRRTPPSSLQCFRSLENLVRVILREPRRSFVLHGCPDWM